MHAPRYFDRWGDELIQESWRPVGWAQSKAMLAWCDDCKAKVQLDHGPQSRNLREG